MSVLAPDSPTRTVRWSMEGSYAERETRMRNPGPVNRDDLGLLDQAWPLSRKEEE